MPGDSPRQAFAAFIAPLQRAAGCLGPCKLVVPASGKVQLGKVHVWTIGLQSEGVALRGGWHLEAQMHYEIIQDLRPGRGPYRVTTRGYNYRISKLEQDLFRFHWHPVGNSTEKDPHVHLNIAIPMTAGTPSPDTLKHHLPTERITFEAAIRTMAEYGAPIPVPGWESVLDDCERDHLLYRSWSRSPGEAATV